MSTVVILLVLAVIIVFAVQSSVKHLKGQGGCCGGDSSPKAKRKKLDSPIIAKKLVTIEGMHCDNCKNRIEKSLNEMDGVACVVNLHKKTATITMCKSVEDSTIKETIERLDFKVLDIVSL
jgi:copper chaperone CopZ